MKFCGLTNLMERNRRLEKNPSLGWCELWRSVFRTYVVVSLGWRVVCMGNLVLAFKDLFWLMQNFFAGAHNNEHFQFSLTWFGEGCAMHTRLLFNCAMRTVLLCDALPGLAELLGTFPEAGCCPLQISSAQGTCFLSEGYCFYLTRPNSETYD